MESVHAKAFETVATNPGPAARAAWRWRLSCALWGHHVDNRLLGEQPADRRCRCGARYLSRDGSITHVRHTLSCFLGHHSYTRLADRDGCHEYVCTQCGHPLVFRAGTDPYRFARGFKKKVRYLCGLFGHHVEVVARREGFTEYACHCGHTFLREDQAGRKIRHPMICVVGSHFIRYLTSRAGYDEFVCVDCGHPFCFAQAAAYGTTRTKIPAS